MNIRDEGIYIDRMDLVRDEHIIRMSSFRPRTPESFLEGHRQSLETRKTILGYADTVLDNLTVLIPTTLNRADHTTLLLEELRRQGIRYLVDDSAENLGDKRQRLYEGCSTKYAISVDSDDWISENFREVIEPYLQYDVDVINFIELVQMNQQPLTCTYRSMHFPWQGCMLGKAYAFAPTPKSIVRVELAKQIKFESGHDGEDLKWGRDLQPLIKSELNIQEILYYYEYLDNLSETKTNSHQQ